MTGSSFEINTIEMILLAGFPSFGSAALHTEESKRRIHHQIGVLAEENNISPDELWTHLSDGIPDSSEPSANRNRERLDILVDRCQPIIDEKRCDALRATLMFRTLPRKFVTPFLAIATLLGFREKVDEQADGAIANHSETFSRSKRMLQLLLDIKVGKWNFLRDLGFDDALLRRYKIDPSKYADIKEPREVMGAALDILAAFTGVTDKERVWSTLCQSCGGISHSIPEFEIYARESVRNFQTYFRETALHGPRRGSFRGDFGAIAETVGECLANGGGLSTLVDPLVGEHNPEWYTHKEPLTRFQIVLTVVARLKKSWFMEQSSYGSRDGSENAYNLDINQAQKIINFLIPQDILGKYSDLKSERFELDGKTYTGAEAAFWRLLNSLDKSVTLAQLRRASCRGYIADTIESWLHSEFIMQYERCSPEDQLVHGIIYTFEEAYEFLYIEFLRQKERFESKVAKDAQA